MGAVSEASVEPGLSAVAGGSNTQGPEIIPPGDIVTEDGACAPAP